MDVLIIGARGVFGALTADAFRAAGWEVRRAVRTPRAGEVEVDLGRPETIAAALRDDELVVNTVPHPALLVERAVLERGGTLINTSALPAAAGRSLRAVAGGARGTVLMNAGLAPGVTTVLAAELLRAHPEATELEIVFTLSSAAPRGPASSGFLHRGLTAVPRHRTVLAPLPPPFGERRCVGFGESDAGWLGGVAEGRVIRVYICIAEPTAHERILALNDAGAMRTLPRTIWGPPRAPGSAPSDEPVAHWVAAKRGDRRLAARTIECRGDYVHAARSTVLFASALRARNPGRGGCFDPEELWTLAELEPLLRAGGVTIASQSVSDLTPAAG